MVEDQAWWRQFPKIESRTRRAPSAADKPDPQFESGTLVRLVARGEKVRRVIRSEWHWHRQEYVYVIETSAPAPFEPYWFAAQLEIADSSPGV